MTLGCFAGSSGTYNLSGNGLLSALPSTSATPAAARSPSRAGPIRWATALYLGYDAGGSGTYNLSGGSLSASSVYIGYPGSGSFTQTGGANTVSQLAIGSGGSYVLGGGTLQVNGGFANQGVFAGGGNPATLMLGGSGVGTFAAAACKTRPISRSASAPTRSCSCRRDSTRQRTSPVTARWA